MDWTLVPPLSDCGVGCKTRETLLHPSVRNVLLQLIINSHWKQKTCQRFNQTHLKHSSTWTRLKTHQSDHQSWFHITWIPINRYLPEAPMRVTVRESAPCLDPTSPLPVWAPPLRKGRILVGRIISSVPASRYCATNWVMLQDCLEMLF